MCKWFGGAAGGRGVTRSCSLGLGNPPKHPSCNAGSAAHAYRHPYPMLSAGASTGPPAAAGGRAGKGGACEGVRPWNRSSMPSRGRGRCPPRTQASSHGPPRRSSRPRKCGTCSATATSSGRGDQPACSLLLILLCPQKVSSVTLVCNGSPKDTQAVEKLAFCVK